MKSVIGLAVASAVFRTAIDARSLHLVRRRFPAVEVLDSSLLIRDESARTAADTDRVVAIATRGVGTADAGGTHSTTEVVDALLDELLPALVARS